MWMVYWSVLFSLFYLKKFVAFEWFVLVCLFYILNAKPPLFYSPSPSLIPTTFYPEICPQLPPPHPSLNSLVWLRLSQNYWLIKTVLISLDNKQSGPNWFRLNLVKIRDSSFQATRRESLPFLYFYNRQAGAELSQAQHKERYLKPLKPIPIPIPYIPIPMPIHTIYTNTNINTYQYHIMIPEASIGFGKDMKC